MEAVIETTIVAAIVAAAAAILVVQLRRKASEGACDCDVGEGGGKCSKCAGMCQPSGMPKCHPESAQSERGDTA